MFFLLPVGMNYQTRRLPVVTFVIMGLNVLIYLVTLVCSLMTKGESDLWVYLNLWLIPAYSGWWAHVTYTFVHAGFFHLLGNMLYLFLFGCCVEDILGLWRFLAFYIFGGSVADLVYIATAEGHFSSEIPLGGASGAVSACMGMYLLLRAGEEIEFKYAYFFLFIGANVGEFSLASWIVIGFWFLKDLFFMGLALITEIEGGVAFAAHVGGFIAGMSCVGTMRVAGWKPDAERARTKVAARARTAVLPGFTAKPAPVVRGSATIYLHANGVESGPFTLSQTRSMRALGGITDETFYWQEGMSEWKSITELGSEPSA
jgi:membrane associated rhomboid family serine protease